MAQLNDITTAYKGEAIRLAFTLTPLTDITGWTIVFTLKKLSTDPASILSVAASGMVNAAGTFNILLSKANSLLPAGDYAYDVQRTDVGSEAVLSIGKFTINQEVKNA